MSTVVKDFMQSETFKLLMEKQKQQQDDSDWDSKEANKE